MQTSNKDNPLSEPTLEKTLYELDHRYRLSPTEDNLNKIENHLNRYSKSELNKLKLKKYPNLCIGAKALAKKQERRIIAQEVKELAMRDKLDL